MVHSCMVSLVVGMSWLAPEQDVLASGGGVFLKKPVKFFP